MSRRTYLIWLEWPERCFRVDAEALRVLRGLVPRGSRIVRARCERSFLGELPRATHVVTWLFRKEWFALAPRLELLATPAAGRELLPETGPAGVKVHFGGFHGRIMAESAVGFMMAWARGFFHPALGKARWPRKELADSCYTLAGTKAVIAGYGKVGKAIGGMSVLNVDGSDYYTIGDLVVPLSKTEALYLALGFDRENNEPVPGLDVFHVTE